MNHETAESPSPEIESTPIHEISHKFQQEIIVPYAAVTNNIEIAVGNKCKFQDGTMATITELDHLNMMDRTTERHVMELYNISSWGLLNQWHLRGVSFDSIYFLKLKFDKEKDG
ncbi:MAG: hypothetical protein WC910_05280 [Bacteroidales bacterium]